MTSVAPQIHDMTSDEQRNVSVDMSGKLNDSELLIGTPTIQASDDLTITSVQINSQPMTINGSSVAAGKAVSFKVDPQAYDSTYLIDILADTDDGQKVEGSITITVEESPN